MLLIKPLNVPDLLTLTCCKDLFPAHEVSIAALAGTPFFSPFLRGTHNTMPFLGANQRVGAAELLNFEPCNPRGCC